MNGRTAKLLNRMANKNKRKSRELKKMWTELPWKLRNAVRRKFQRILAQEELDALKLRNKA